MIPWSKYIREGGLITFPQANRMGTRDDFEVVIGKSGTQMYRWIGWREYATEHGTDLSHGEFIDAVKDVMESLTNDGEALIISDAGFDWVEGVASVAAASLGGLEKIERMFDNVYLVRFE